MKQRSKYYTYTLESSLTGTVFYVGKGKGDRIYVHEKEAKKGVLSLKCDTIREIWSQGGEVIRKKVFETDIEQDAYMYEWVLVNLIYGLDQLTNFWEGGNGGTVKRKIFYKPISLMLSSEILKKIDAITPDTRTAYIKRVLQANLTDDIALHPLIPLMFNLKHRYSFGVQFPLDLLARLERIPSGKRSAVIEFLVRRETGLITLDNLSEN